MPPKCSTWNIKAIGGPNARSGPTAAVTRVLRPVPFGAKIPLFLRCSGMGASIRCSPVCFVNVQSVDRILYSIVQRFNLEWKARTLRALTQAA